jgi:hypothetical protein
VALLGKRRAAGWIRYQGRANAALVLLARAMEAHFVAPRTAEEFGGVNGRVKGCTFELRVVETPGEPPALVVKVRHYHSHGTCQLDGPGCVVPDLDPEKLRAAIEYACYTFSTAH